jgi:hypothetical protein
MRFYFGAGAGGVWKTTDGGTYWHNISDGYLKTAAVGAMAVAPSDPHVLYVGMGETTIVSARIDRQLARWQELLEKDVSTFNTLVRNADIPAIVP